MNETYLKVYERELQRARSALLTAKSVRELRAIKNRIKFLEQMVGKTSNTRKRRSRRR